MRTIHHTITAEAAGYPDVLVEFNVGVSGAVIERAATETACAAFVTDLPNWDAVADELGCVDADGQALPKPTFPLSAETSNDLPIMLSSWLSCQLGIMTAVRDHVQTVIVPNSMRR